MQGERKTGEAGTQAQRRGGRRTLNTYRVDFRAPLSRSQSCANAASRSTGGVRGGLQTVSGCNGAKARWSPDAAPVGGSCL